jgi:hypothetical protein
MSTNRKYYIINFVLHLFYGSVIWTCIAYGLEYANYAGLGSGGGGRWSNLVGMLGYFFLIPAPIITNVLCIRACYKNSGSHGEFFKCIGIAILAGPLSGFIVAAIGMSLGYR